MADQADVENALVDAISSALYPGGASAPSVLGVLTRVYRGWPQSISLDTDLAAGNVNISVFPVPSSITPKTRFPAEWYSAPGAVRLVIQQVGETVTFDGDVDPGVIVGIIVDEETYAYHTQIGDSVNSVVEQVGNLVRARRDAFVLNNTLYIPGAARIIARVQSSFITTTEVRRQSQVFRISFWCATPEIRDQACARVDLWLAGLNFLTLSDGSSARLISRGGETIDRDSDANLYRRDILYEAEFATTTTQLQMSMLFGSLGINGQSDRLA